MGFADDARSFARRQGAPVSVFIVGSLVLAALYALVDRSNSIAALALTPNWMGRPWTLVTYPWAYDPLSGGGFGLFGLIFLGMWVLGPGATVERDLGSGRYAVFMLLMTVLPGLLIGIGSRAIGVPMLLAGPWLPEAAMTVAWATRSPNALVHLFGVLPIAAKWIGLVAFGGVLVSYGAINGVLGILACIPLLLAFAFAANRIPGLSYGGGTIRGFGKKEEVHATRAQARYGQEYYDDVKRREQERAERERLRKLFEGSLKDDDK